MIVRVRMFAAARQLVGAEQVEVELTEGATVADLRQALGENYPAVASLLPQSLFAIDAEYVRDDTIVAPTAEIVVIPPVSGG
ncbi:MAG: MoaD/ThiS family protein [Pirellulales bacterium]|nr:MoaD/ThiS family protein [Pirellulales bacterium]